MSIRIQIECNTVEELAAMISHRDDERDAFRDEIARLLERPLAFGLPQLATEVLAGIRSLTPDQAEKIRELIEAGTKGGQR